MTQIRGRAKPARLLRDSWSLTSPQSGHRPSGTGLPLRVTTRRIRARGPAVNGPTQYWWCATLERVCRGHDRNGCRAVRHVQPPQEVGHVLLCRRGRNALGELADERPVRLVIRGHDCEADVRMIDLRGRCDAPERHAEVERSQETKDGTRAIEDEHTRGRDRREVHTLYSPPN